MTPCTHENADRILERCAERRRWFARWEATNPSHARQARTIAAGHGHVAEVDDPIIRVRASELEAVCAVVVLVPVLFDLASTVDDLTDTESAALAVVAPLLGDRT